MPRWQPDGREGHPSPGLELNGCWMLARRRSRRRDILREIGLLAAGSGRYRGSREELVPVLRIHGARDPPGVVSAEAAASRGRATETTVAPTAEPPPGLIRRA